jgi:transcriptional regulator with XRE-family HTH domain
VVSRFVWKMRYGCSNILGRMTIGTRVKRLRRQRRLSQLALAKHAGISQPYLWELEAGQKTNPGIAVLRKLAKALGVQVARLVE